MHCTFACVAVQFVRHLHICTHLSLALLLCRFSTCTPVDINAMNFDGAHVAAMNY